MAKKVSEISEKDLLDYCRIDNPGEQDKNFLNEALDIAKSFIKSYTGVEELDDINEFVIVVYILVQDMYDNRSLYIDKNNLNITAETILNMHSVNLL